MQIEVKELEPYKLSIQYEADAEQILNKRGEIITHFKKAPVPGFRAGKAPLDAIKAHYRNQIEESLKRALAEDAFHNTLFEKKLRPHGAPRFNTLLLDHGKFTCEFEMFTKPDFDLPNFQEIEVPKPHEAQTVTELTEQMIQELRVRYGESSPYEDNDFVQVGDNVIIDYEGSIDGQKLDAICAVGEMLTVGKSALVDFDNSLLGMTLAETREFNLLVPENGLPSLANRNVQMKVTLSMGSKNVPCPMNDDLAKKFGKETFVELKELVSLSAQSNLQTKNKTSLFEAIANRLINDIVVPVPNWMALSEAQYLAHNSKLDWTLMSDVDKEKYLEMAEKNVKLALILDKTRDVFPEAQLTDQEVFEVVKQNLAKNQEVKNIDETIKEMNKSGYLQILFSRVRDEHAMDYLAKSIKVIE